MSRFTRLLITGALSLATLATIAPMASAQPRVFFRGGYYGPGFYGPSWYGWYGPSGGPYGYGYVSGPPAGSIKFEHTMKDVSVFVDGGFAGTVGQLKTFKLHAGTHNIELRNPDGHSFYQERVEVVPGKTLKLTP